METKDISTLLEQQQTGQYIPTEEDKITIQGPRGPRKSLGTNITRVRDIPSLSRDHSIIGYNTDVSEQAALAGWGESRFDRGTFDPEKDLENSRAIEQSSGSKILNGAVKGGIVAATTAVETVAGVIDGLLEGGYELARQIADGEDVSLSRAVGRGVNNFTARTMADIQRLSEEWFPNYRTEYERSDKYQDEWWKHVGSANFIGDSFLKNFGFTVGAMAGGAAWAKVIGAGIRAAQANNLLKGVVAAAEGNKEVKAALGNAMKLVDKGKIASIADDPAIAKIIGDSARGLNRMSTAHQLFGGVIGAMGEGTFEGVMARNEFMEGRAEKLRQEYYNELAELEETFANLSNPMYTRGIPVVNPDGTTGVKYELNDAGRQLLEQKRQKLNEDYIRAQEFMNELGDRVAATTFIWNLPILTVSNTMQFGRMLSGGFNTSRNVAQTVGNIARKEGKLISDVAAKNAGKGALLGKTAMYSLKNAGAEAAEEMSQGFVSSGAKRVADARLTSFNDDGFDRDSLNDLGTWVGGMLEGGMDYLKEGRNWQEGFLGMMTGLIGIPGRRWNGGVAEAYRTAKEEVNGARDAASALNTLVNSERFQNAIKGYVRHQKYETEMADGIRRDDKYAWKTASDKQLINDIITFANAGRLDDLKDIVDYYANMPEDDSNGLEVVQAVTGEHNSTEVKNNPRKVVRKVKNSAKEIKDSIQTYSDMYDAMTTIAPVGTSRDQIEEMIAASMNIKAFENRFMDMFGKLLNGIETQVKTVSLRDDDGKKLKKRAQLQRAKDIRSTLAEVLTDITIPLNPDLIEQFEAIPALSKLKSEIDNSGDSELRQMYSDMKKLAMDRKAFVNKLLTLKNLSSDDFATQAQNADKVIEEQKKEEAEKEFESFINLAGVKTQYNVQKKKNMGNIGEFIEKLRKGKDKNQFVSQFLDLHDAYSDLRKAYVRQSGTLTGIESEIIDKLFDEAVDKTDLTDASRIDTYEQYMDKQNKKISESSNFDAAMAYHAAKMNLSKETYDAAVQKVVSAMQSLDDIRSNSSGRQSSKPEPEPAPAPASSTVQGEGNEPAAPGSKAREDKKKSAKLNDGNNSAEDASGRVWTVGEKVYTYDENKSSDIVEEFTVKEFTEGKNGDVRMYLTGPREMSVSLKTQTYFIHKEPRAVSLNTTVIDESVKSPSRSELLDDAVSTPEYVSPQKRKASGERNRRGQKQYYQTAIPEFTSESSNRYFNITGNDDEAAEQRKLAIQQLEDFIGPRMDDKVIQKLVSENAWTNAVKQVRVGDKVQFLSLEGYNDDKDKPVIFMAVEKEGQRYIFNVMRRGGEGFNEYEGLQDFLDAFDLTVKYDQKGEYVFSKQATVWGKRDGIIDYTYSDNYSGERPIARDDHGVIMPGIEGYDENAPIVWVNGEGQFDTLRGNPNAARSIYTWRNMDAQRRRELRGALYYLADNGNGGYLPVRLGIEHFTPDNYMSDNPTFAAIRRSLSNIEGLAGRFFNEIEQAADDEAKQRILEEENKALHQEVANGLRKYVDLTHGFFTFVLDKEGKPWLRYDRNSSNKSDNDVDGFWLNHGNYNHLMDDFAKERVSMDFRPKHNLDDFIKNGFITSNAKKLLPKQVDVYITHWKDGDFAATDAQKELVGNDTPSTVEKEVAATTEPPVVGSAPEPGVLEAPTVDTYKPSSMFSSVDFEENELAEMGTKPKEEKKRFWDILTDTQKTDLVNHYGAKIEQKWEKMDEDSRRNLLDCVKVK